MDTSNQCCELFSKHFCASTFTWPTGSVVSYIMSSVFVNVESQTGCHDRIRDNFHLFCDCLVEMVHTHASQQEGEVDSSIMKMSASIKFL